MPGIRCKQDINQIYKIKYHEAGKRYEQNV